MFTHLSSTYKQRNILHPHNMSINRYTDKRIRIQKIIFYFRGIGGKYKEGWMKYDKLHRINAPASITYSIISGQIKEKLNCHESAPAVISYYENGKIEVETWWINGKRYRSDGPAVISYFENGL